MDSRIYEDMILWTNDPFKCGEASDLSIFRRGIKNAILSDKLVIADRGYPESRFTTPPGSLHSATRKTRILEIIMKT